MITSHRQEFGFERFSSCCWRLAVYFLAFALLAAGTSVRAGLTTNSPLLPPLNGAYLSPAGVHATYTGTSLQIVLSSVMHAGFSNVVATPDSGGTLETFDSMVTGSVAVDFGPDSIFDVFFDITLIGPTKVFVGGGYTPGSLGTFPTEMLQLDLVGVSPFNSVHVREDPTRPSLGQTTITPVGPGMYHIDSFFDVFTELSLDGGASWIPSASSTHVELGPVVPEPASLVVWLLLSLTLGAGCWRRCTMGRTA